MVPRPVALQLASRARNVRIPQPPFGLPAWSAEADAMAILLDGEETDVEDPAAVAAQIPLAGERLPGSAMFVLGKTAQRPGLLRRWLGPRAVIVSRAARCTALLARGYVLLGAGIDPLSGIDIAWGSTLRDD